MINYCKQSKVKQEQQPATYQPTIQQPRIELFGVPQLSSLGEAPKYTIGDRFATWQQKIEAFVGAQGLDPMVTLPPEQSWNEATAANTANVPISMLQRWYLQAGKRIVHAISLATINAGLDCDQLFADACAGKPDAGVVTIGSMRIDVDANPYLIMQTLRDKYDTKTPYAAISIWKKLLEIRWDRNKDKGSKHLQSVRDLFTQLDRLVADDRPKAGECFGETMKAIILLNTLPSSLATDVKILTTQDKITIAQVESLVRKYDDLQSNIGKSDKFVDKANVMTQDKQQGKKQHNKQRPNKFSNKPQQFDRNKKRRSNEGTAIKEGDIFSAVMYEAANDHAQIDEDDAAATDAALSAEFTSEQESRTIILDSGATRHMWSQPADVTDVQTLDYPIRLLTATGRAVPVFKTGTVHVSPTIRLGEVAVVPQAQVNLMSVSRITKAGYRVVFEGIEAFVLSRTTNKVYLKFTNKDGLFVREMMTNSDPDKPRPKLTVGFQVQPANKPNNDNKKSAKPAATADKKPATAATGQQADKSADTKGKQVAPVAKKPATAALIRETMYHLAEAKPDTVADTDTAHTATAAADPLTHARFGHQSFYSNADCETCLATRAKRVPITRKPYVSATQPLGTLVADLIGPVSAMIDGQRQSLPSIGGNIYILVVVDEFTRYAWVFLLRNKSDTASQVINLLTLLKRQYSQYPIRRFHTDGGLEFVNRTVDDYLATEGINHTTTTRDKPSHNGKAERYNQTLIALIRSMLHGCQADLSLWGDAAVQASYVYNRTPLRVINNSTPYELLNGKQPDLSKIKVFGSNVFYSINENERSKIQATSHKGVWIGWDERKNGHRIMINSDGHVIVSRDVKHVENKFSHLAEFMGSAPEPAGLLGSSTAAHNRLTSATNNSVDTLILDSYNTDDTAVAADTSVDVEAHDASSPISSQPSPSAVQHYTDDDDDGHTLTQMISTTPTPTPTASTLILVMQRITVLLATVQTLMMLMMTNTPTQLDH